MTNNTMNNKTVTWNPQEKKNTSGQGGESDKRRREGERKNIKGLRKKWKRKMMKAQEWKMEWEDQEAWELMVSDELGERGEGEDVLTKGSRHKVKDWRRLRRSDRQQWKLVKKIIDSSESLWKYYTIDSTITKERWVAGWGGAFHLTILLSFCLSIKKPQTYTNLNRKKNRYK